MSTLRKKPVSGRIVMLRLACGVIAVSSPADEVRLKNGSVLEGIVREDTDTGVVLDIGVGSMTVARGRIERVVLSTEEANRQIVGGWQKQYFLHEKYVTARLADLAETFRKLADRRAEAVRNRRLLDRSAARESQAVKGMQAMKERLVAVSRKMEGASPSRDVAAYNALVMESNSIRNQTVLAEKDLDGIRRARAQATEGISGYLEALLAFRTSFAERSAGPARGEGESHFFAEVGKRLAGMESEFAERPVPVQERDGSTTVAALVNGQVRGRFILDTGAALVTISRGFAERLRLDVAAQPTVEVVLADGGRVKARPVLLQSIQLGDARADNVEGVVMDSTVGEGIDGLLGMSFLRRFVMHFDGATGTLLLKEFNPQ